MKNSPLKIIFTILLCLPLVAAVFIGIRIDPLQISEGTLSALSVKDINTGESKVFEDEETLSYYVAITSAAQEIDHPLRDISGDIPLEVTFSESDGESVYEFYLSEDGEESYYKNSAGKYFVLQKSDAVSMLMREENLSAYPENIMPEIFLSVDGQEISAIPESYSWNWSMIDGSEVSNTTLPEKQNAAIFVNSLSTVSEMFKFAPDRMSIVCKRGNETLLAADSIQEVVSALSYSEDTNLKLEIEAEWFESDSVKYSGNALYSLDLIFDIPATWSLDDTVLRQGGFTSVKLYNFNDYEELSVDTDISDYYVSEVYDNNGEKFAFLAIGSQNTAGNYTIGFCGGEKVQFEIRDRYTDGFETQAINITDSDMMNVNTEEAWEEYNQKMDEILSSSAKEKLWSGNEFVTPVVGNVLTRYGTRRFVSSYTKEYIHNAMDYSATAGSAVSAVNSGRVVFADTLTLTGKTVVIDHGYGLFSIYGCLDTMYCAEGEDVSKGQGIGTVGNTGFAYGGSQLHFAMTVNGEYIYPVHLTGVITYPN